MLKGIGQEVGRDGAKKEVEGGGGMETEGIGASRGSHTCVEDGPSGGQGGGGGSGKWQDAT
jgi:hypothetical protein